MSITNGNSGQNPDHGKDVTFMVHDEDDGASGTFTVKRGSRLSDAITEAYKAVARTRAETDQIKAEGTGEAISAAAHETVAAYLAHGGTLVWLIFGPTGGASR